MRLTEEEAAMLAGEQGPVRQWAVRHQIAVGDFFDAPDFVPVGQAHVMADTESLGEEGVRWLEDLAALPSGERRVRVPTITDPRGVDFDTYKRLGQTDAMAHIEMTGRTVLAACAEGDNLRTSMAMLRRFAKYEPVNAIELRRRIAGRLIDAERYIV